MMIEKFNQSINRSSNELDWCCSLAGWYTTPTQSPDSTTKTKVLLSLSLSLSISISF